MHQMPASSHHDRLSSGQVKASWSRIDWAVAIFLLVLAGLPFWQVGGFAFLNYDDPLHVSAQPAVLAGLSPEGIQWSISATPSNLWHPLTWISYMAEVSWFGGGAESPAVHHWGNLILHLGSTGCFFVLLRLLRIATVLAAVVALLFSWHPLHVEPVAWISSRKDVLYAFWAMASLCSYWLSQRDPRQKARGAWFWLTLGLYALALTSKPSAIVLPLLYLLLDLLPSNESSASATTEVKSGRLSLSLQWLRRRAKGKWMYGALAVITALIAVQQQYGGSHSEWVGQQGLLSRLAYLPASLGFYLQHSFLPRHLTFEYAFPEGGRYILLSAVGLLFLMVLTYALIQRLRSGNDRLATARLARWRFVSFAGLWFLVCLAPVLGFFYVGSGFTADRYAYLALAGPAITLALAVQSLPVPIRSFSLAAVALVTAYFGLMTYQQSKVWRDDWSLFSYGVLVEPQSGTAQSNLAALYRQKGQDDLALVHFEKALQLPASHHIVHYNMARIYAGKGQNEMALESCRKSLAAYPRYARSHYFLAQLHERQGSGESLSHYQQACDLQPANGTYAIACANRYARRQQYREAEQLLRRCLATGVISEKERQQIHRMLKKLAVYLD